MEFSRYLRAIKTDSYRRSKLGLLLFSLFLGAWAAWAFLARVSLFAVSTSARLEVAGRARMVESPVSGKVKEVRVRLGQAVAEGDVLVELDSARDELRRVTMQAELVSLEQRLANVRGQIRIEEQVLEEIRKAAGFEEEEVDAQIDAAAEQLQKSVDLVTRYEKLRAKGGGAIAETIFEAAKAECEVNRANLSAARARLKSVKQKAIQDRIEQKAKIEGYRLIETEHKGAISVKQRSIELVKHDINGRTVRAPLAGIVGSLAEKILPGAYVEAGDELCAVVPGGGEAATRADYKIVAAFPIRSSLTQLVKKGQRGVLRLDAYPFTQYGSVDTEVESFETEPQGGLKKVELKIVGEPNPQIRLDHGLAGTLEVQVERVSPAVLLLRMVGGMFSGAEESPDAGKSKS